MPWRLLGVMLGIELSDSLSLGEALVGVGTLALAAFTAWLGTETGVSAKAAEQAVEQAEEPYVIGTPTPPDQLVKSREMAAGLAPPYAIHRWEERGESGQVRRVVLRLRLWNIGAGPAILHEVRLRTHTHDREPRELVLADGLPAHEPIAAGQVADTPVPSLRWHGPGAGVLRIEYTHSNGNRYATESDSHDRR